MATTTTNGSTSTQFGPLLAALEYLQGIDADMSVLTLRALLLIADQPGIPMVELTSKLEVASSTASRIVSRLGKFGQAEKPGCNLIEAEENPADRRVKLVTLTTKGERVVERIKGLLE